MEKYEVTFSRSARKELENLNPKLVKRILMKIKSLAINPRPKECEKLKGQTNLWRVRIGNYRIIYSIFDSEFLVDISMIRDRKDDTDFNLSN